MTTAEKLVKIAENEQKVYKAGQQSEYDRFWDAYQQNGNRANYQHAFPGEGWTNENFKPKYNIIPAGNASNFFNQTFISGDVVNILARQNVILDFSNTTRMQSGFYYARYITHLGILNFSKLDTSSVYMFGTCSALHTIDKIIVTEKTVYLYWFEGCYALKEIRFEGVIGNSLDIHWSTNLSAESYNSIFTAMSTTVTGQTITFPTTAQATYDAKYGAGQWSMWVSYLSNWTFAYA
jgi:hypothetical protein